MKFIQPFKGFYSVFLPCAILSLENKNADPLFLNVMFVKMISKPQGGFPQFLYFKLKI